jgi:hypothetical protein
MGKPAPLCRREPRSACVEIEAAEIPIRRRHHLEAGALLVAKRGPNGLARLVVPAESSGHGSGHAIAMVRPGPEFSLGTSRQNAELDS